MELRSYHMFREADYVEFRVMEIWLWISALLAAGSLTWKSLSKAQFLFSCKKKKKNKKEWKWVGTKAS